VCCCRVCRCVPFDPPKSHVDLCMLIRPRTCAVGCVLPPPPLPGWDAGPRCLCRRDEDCAAGLGDGLGVCVFPPAIDGAATESDGGVASSGAAALVTAADPVGAATTTVTPFTSVITHADVVAIASHRAWDRATFFRRKATANTSAPLRYGTCSETPLLLVTQLTCGPNKCVQTRTTRTHI
jgi:hypothetical protein